MLFQAEDQGEREERLLLKRHDQRINRGLSLRTLVMFILFCFIHWIPVYHVIPCYQSPPDFPMTQRF
jgi:hypothetical protein